MMLEKQYDHLLLRMRARELAGYNFYCERKLINE